MLFSIKKCAESYSVLNINVILKKRYFIALLLIQFWD